MNDLAKSTITKDSFIFSINQAYEARIKNDGSFNSHLKFGPFLEKTWILPTSPTLASFKKTLGEIIEHHFATLPNYHRAESVNIENVSWFSHSVAALFADIEFLVMAYTGQGFPLLKIPQIPHTSSSKNIDAAIKKYLDFKKQNTNGEKFSLFSLDNEEDFAQQELYAQEIWSLIFYLIKKVFGNYTDIMSSYVVWKYSIKSNASDIVDWNVRPPCGDLYRKQFKHLFEKDYFKNNPKKNGNNNKDIPQKPEYPKTNRIVSDVQPRLITDEGKPLEDALPFQKLNTITKQAPRDYPAKSRQNNFDNNEQHQAKPAYKSRREKPPRSDAENQQNQEEIIEKALLEASLAVNKMKINKNLEEISLSPQNSFLRRQQHVVISEGGFETESRGEGSDRHVCIIRK